MIRRLLEAKTLDYEYEKDWKDIPREIFDKIIVLDPQTNIAQNRLGPCSKQLLLPKYLSGEVDFLDKADDVKKALELYIQNRGTYPSVLKNIANFPSVKDFVDFVLNGENSEFAKNFDLDALNSAPKEKENKLDLIYNKYYNKIDREIFNKIITLDPTTTDSSIGEVAKNLLLPKYQAGEDFLSDSENVKDAVENYYEERDTYPADRKELGKYASVKDFTDFVLGGGESTFKRWMQSKVDDGTIKASDFRYIASTRNYDIVQPFSWEANACIVGKDSPTNSSYKLRWCTGYMCDRSYWNSYSRTGPIVCFIWKEDPWNREKARQINLRSSDSKVAEFLDGDDTNKSGKGAAGYWESFLMSNVDVAKAIANSDVFKNNPEVIKVNSIYKMMKDQVEINSLKDLYKIKQDQLQGFVNDVKINLEIIPAGCFIGYDSLKKVTFNPNLKKIGVQAFFNCGLIKYIELPDKLEEIGAEAFAGCTSLSGTVRLPDSLVKVGRGAFRDTACKISINKDRKTKLIIDKNDYDWFASKAKAITIQNNESVEEDLTEDLITIDENIPRDLARAYEQSRSAERGIQQHPESAHTELRDKKRRSVIYDYANSNYEELSKEEAIQYLGLRVNVDPNVRDENGKIVVERKVSTSDREQFNSRISNLRFIIDGKVVEYEVRGGNVLYLAYWCEIPTSYFRDYPLFKGKGYDTTDVRFANKYSDIYVIIQISDKIYKTDEYEHLITDETPVRGKVKKPRLNADGTPALDDQGNPIYDIVDDTIVARRQRNRRWRDLRTMVPKDSSDFRQHASGYNFGHDNDGEFTYGISPNRYHKRAADVPDTGSHDKRKIFQVITNGGGIASIPDYGNYVAALIEKQRVFKQYDYARKALAKLEAEKDLYDEDEYNEEHELLTNRRNEAYQIYLDRAKTVRQVKDKLLFVIDESVEQSNKLIKQTLVKIQDLENRRYEIGKKIQSLKGTSIKTFSSRLSGLERTLNTLDEEIKRTRTRQEELQAQIARLQSEMHQNDLNIESKLDQYQKYEEEISEVAETEMTRKFEQMDQLNTELEEVMREIEAHTSKKGADSNKPSQPATQGKKELDPRLVSIISTGEGEGEGDDSAAAE